MDGDGLVGWVGGGAGSCVSGPNFPVLPESPRQIVCGEVNVRVLRAACSGFQVCWVMADDQKDAPWCNSVSAPLEQR